MQHAFTIGHHEKHVVLISDDKFWGSFRVTIDNYIAIDNTFVLSFNLTRTWNLTVGVNERHALCIQKTRPMFFPYFKPHQYRIWVDNILVHQFEA
jgi:hypothetical protein